MHSSKLQMDVSDGDAAERSDNVGDGDARPETNHQVTFEEEKILKVILIVILGLQIPYQKSGKTRGILDKTWLTCLTVCKTSIWLNIWNQCNENIPHKWIIYTYLVVLLIF